MLRKSTIWLSSISLLKSQHSDISTARSRIHTSLIRQHMHRRGDASVSVKMTGGGFLASFNQSPVKAQLLNNLLHITELLLEDYCLQECKKKKITVCQTISSSPYIRVCVHTDKHFLYICKRRIRNILLQHFELST